MGCRGAMGMEKWASDARGFTQITIRSPDPDVPSAYSLGGDKAWRFTKRSQICRDGRGGTRIDSVATIRSQFSREGAKAQRVGCPPSVFAKRSQISAGLQFEALTPTWLFESGAVAI